MTQAAHLRDLRAARRSRRDDDAAQLRAELELARSELTRLRAEAQRPDDAERAAALVAQAIHAAAAAAEVSATQADDEDRAWALRAETERIRASLIRLCTELEKALHATVIELEGDLPLVQVDRRRPQRAALELVDPPDDGQEAGA